VHALQQTVETQRLQALLLAIRKDEHGIRAKERYFSPRDRNFRWDYAHQPPELWELFRSQQAADHHVRVHPLLAWTELDVWRYIQREKIPVVGLYFAQAGKRYRSIGCACCCQPVPSTADSVQSIIRELRTTTVAERSGRAQDKENAYTMQKLRSLGYM
ncbi:MAG: phosphoadenosine phosphosulfate reductase family protein, partial [Candidatus Omnitrophica bacterium]|nr:phosphoadenosine phosphosulfate reductase family protein [Candidatus Omnitrophota bacterium]